MITKCMKIRQGGRSLLPGSLMRAKNHLYYLYFVRWEHTYIHTYIHTIVHFSSLEITRKHAPSAPKITNEDNSQGRRSYTDDGKLKERQFTPLKLHRK